MLNRRQAMRVATGLVTAAALIGLVAPADAKPRIYTGLVSGTGAGGYDVVAYQTAGRATRGSKAHTTEWQGATWRFSSAQNLAAFKASPSRYAPAYGGYCAWAVSQGYTAKGDPRHWKVVGGKLYLNYSAGIKKRWLKDVPGHIRRGNANWPKVLN